MCFFRLLCLWVPCSHVSANLLRKYRPHEIIIKTTKPQNYFSGWLQIAGIMSFHMRRLGSSSYVASPFLPIVAVAYFFGKNRLCVCGHIPISIHPTQPQSPMGSFLLEIPLSATHRQWPEGSASTNPRQNYSLLPWGLRYTTVTSILCFTV